ncbi:MAG: hypothetical protein STSR0003_15050 [Smithella sp.]|jgi:hypothetical protein
MINETNTLLSIDNDFEPATADEGDELFPNGIFLFNITKMIAYIEKHPNEFAPEMVPVEKHRSSFASLDEDHIETTDYSRPIILAEIKPGVFNVIDGNHRLEKAYRSNIELIPAYVLHPKDHMPFLTSVKAYRSYVEYWNFKINGSRAFRKARRRKKQTEEQ